MTDNNIFSYTFCFIESILVFYMYNNVLTTRYTLKVKRVIFSASAIMLSIIIYFFNSVPFHIKIISLITTMAILAFVNYKNKFYIILFFAMVSMYIFLITDIIMSTLFATILKSSIEIIFNNNFYTILIYISAKIFNFILFYIFSKVFKSTNFNIETKYWIMLDIIMITNLFIAVVLMEKTSGIFTMDNGLLHYFLFAITFLLMSCFVIYFFIQICVFFEREKQFYITYAANEALNQQINLQNTMMDNIRKIKHDIKNNLINISYLVSENKIEDVKKYINELTSKVENVKIISSSGNTIIDAIINCKITLCESYKIKLNLYIEKLPQINASYEDVSNILSNILDNAIEANLKLKPSERFITVRAFVYKGYVSFSIKNRYNSNDILNIENGVICTTKENKSLHGYGMKLIKETTDNNNGVFRYFNEDNLFNVNIMLPIK